MDRDPDETEIDAAYRHLSRAMLVKLNRRAEWSDLQKLLVEAYQRRADLNRNIMDAEAALGIKPQ